MIGVIMAAGVGKRIKELTGDVPKSFLKIKNKSIIESQIETFIQNGIKDIIIVVGYRRELFEKLVKKYHVKLIFNPFYRITNVLGSFWFASKFIKEPFIFVHADTYFEPEILKRLLLTKGNAMAVDFKEYGEEEMKVSVKGGLVVDVSKGLKDADGEFIGLAKIEDFKKVIAEAEKLVEENTMAFFELPILQLIRKKVKFRAVDISGLLWEEIDFKEDYESLVKRAAVLDKI